MFDIKIGTLIPAESALTMIPQLNAVGFESYELNFNDCCALAREISRNTESAFSTCSTDARSPHSAYMQTLSRMRIPAVRSRILSQMQSISIVTE